MSRRLGAITRIKNKTKYSARWARASSERVSKPACRRRASGFDQDVDAAAAGFSVFLCRVGFLSATAHHQFTSSGPKVSCLLRRALPRTQFEADSCARQFKMTALMPSRISSSGLFRRMLDAQCQRLPSGGGFLDKFTQARRFLMRLACAIV